MRVYYHCHFTDEKIQHPNWNNLSKTTNLENSCGPVFYNFRIFVWKSLPFLSLWCQICVVCLEQAFKQRSIKIEETTSYLNDSVTFLYKNTGVDKLSLKFLTAFMMVEINWKKNEIQWRNLHTVIRWKGSCSNLL